MDVETCIVNFVLDKAALKHLDAKVREMGFISGRSELLRRLVHDFIERKKLMQ